jgi:hypothetical protein
MKHAYTLSQKDIKQAVLEFLENSGITIQDATSDDVLLIYAHEAEPGRKFSAVIEAGEV